MNYNLAGATASFIPACDLGCLRRLLASARDEHDERRAVSVPRFLYTLLVALATPLALLRLLWRSRRQPAYRENVGERFGVYAIAPHANLIWLHAVSVGETRAAEPLVAAVRQAYPDHRILLTQTTPTGRDTARQIFGDAVQRCYLPYDLPFAVTRFLRHYRPVAGMLMETELWPNLIATCAKQRVPLLLVNARLSERSAHGYARLRGLTGEMLGALAAIGAQSPADAQRLRTLGAKKVVVTGNMKYDRGPAQEDLRQGETLRARIGTRPVFLAASTREGEETLILEAIADAPSELLTVIVPRHPQRFDDVARLLEKLGVRYQRRSADSAVDAATRALLGDSMGEMYAYYAACDVAFVGGSLLPLGGQNLLEACAVGKPVLIGPHTYNFSEATVAAVAAGAAVQVSDALTLRDALFALLQDPGRRASMSEAGRALMRAHQGATRRTLQLLQDTLKPSA
jgi:3-deoxy-D-manno-octulosonic-acid transferase